MSRRLVQSACTVVQSDPKHSSLSQQEQRMTVDNKAVSGCGFLSTRPRNAAVSCMSKKLHYFIIQPGEDRGQGTHTDHAMQVHTLFRSYLSASGMGCALVIM